ncbi:MAG: hypothetical protein ACI9DC_000381 [Gammaproteobacteria bacterium]|jgi:hypothetical protein
MSLARAYDFILDRCANDQMPMCLTVIDEHTQECLAIDVAGRRIREPRVIDNLNYLTPNELMYQILQSASPMAVL